MRAPGRLLVSSLLALVVAACHAGDGGKQAEDGALSLVIESPARGSISDASQVVVRGKLLGAGSSGAEITVNGQPAERRGGGQFEAAVQLQAGMNLIEIAAGGITDVRAVLQGKLVPASEPAAGAVALHLTPESVAALGESGEAMVDSLLSEFAGSDEPVATFGVTCFNADLYLERIDAEDLVVEPRLAAGGLEFDVEVVGLSATLRAEYSFLCAQSTSQVLLDAGLLAAGARIAVSKDEAAGVAVEMIDLTTQVEDLSLEGDLPEDFDAELELAVRSFFTAQVAEIVPSLVEDVLAGLRTTAELELAGTVMRLGIEPTDVSFTEERGMVLADSSVEVVGQDGLSYLSTPRPIPEAGSIPHTLGIAVADDLFDQLLGAAWSAGVLELDEDATGQYAILETVGADHAELSLPLPPTLAPTESGTPTVTIGDLDLLLTRGGELVAQLAISMEMELDFRLGDGALELAPGDPQIWITVVESDGAFGEREINIVRELARTLLSESFGLAVGGVPIPDQLGDLIGTPDVATAAGYVFIGGDAPSE